jgi:type IV pilus assembly protein PilC
MATFAYAGRTRTGESVQGERAADSVDAAVAALRRDQIVVTRISPVGDGAAVSRLRSLRPHRVAPKTLAVFTRQFSVMIDAGLPLVQCLEILGTQEEDKHFAATLLATRSDVERGLSLAEAMKRHPKTFDALFTNMIAAGEAGGILDTILKRLATYIEKSVKLRSQVKSAMVYPAAVMTIAAVVVTVILWKVIPTFATLFAGLGANLPLPTRIVIAASNALVTLMPFVIVGIVALVFGFQRYYATERGRRVVDGLLLRLPILGLLLRKIAVARFCRTLSTLLASGVAILEALDITGRTAGNAVVEDAVTRTRRSIERGETIAQPLRATAVFPPMVVQMIGVGEATGELDNMLGKIADFYEEEVDVAVAGLLSLLEPAMIAILGGIVGAIVIAMYMPIFSLISNLTN